MDWPEPAWEIALLFPPQGHWTEEEYLELDSNRLVEFSGGSINVLRTPTTTHQLILQLVYHHLEDHVSAHGLGMLLIAGYRIRLRAGTFREPDIAFFLAEHNSRIHNEFGGPPDLAVEVVAEDREHDFVTKRIEYAEVGIPEYWIVDPEEERITVLRLAGNVYEVHGEFGEGSVASSVLLPDFTIDVTDVLAQRIAE
jgi:Uma2 family endonuclease